MTDFDAAPAARPSAEPLVRVRGLEHAYAHGKPVLRGVDLDLRPGEILGYIGPNGSGKTTTVKALAGLLGGSRGELSVLGLDPRVEPLEVKLRTGYLPENAVLFDTLTVAEFLLFVGRLRELEDAVVVDRGTRFLRALDLEPRLSSRLGALSKGQRQKVLLTAAVLHGPRLLFVDEPLSGLDVNAAILMKEFLRGLAQRGVGVLYCSHVMDVVERLCSRIVILHEGRVAAEGPFDELARELPGTSLEGIFSGLTGSGEEGERAAELVRVLYPDGARAE